MTPFSTPPTKSQILERITEYLQTSGQITALEHKEIETAILDTLFTDRPLLGDIKEVACTDPYISANFETSGVNIGRGKVGTERYGWAICNGSNSTLNKMGRVGIGYDPTNYPMNSLPGGEKNVTLGIGEIPPHYHHTPNSVFKSFAAGSGDYANSSSTGTGSDGGDNRELAIAKLGTTNANSPYSTGGAALERTMGGGGSHNNMQPYVISLFIQKISTPY
jgi:microcystin-dependent protein